MSDQPELIARKKLIMTNKTEYKVEQFFAVLTSRAVEESLVRVGDGLDGRADVCARVGTECCATVSSQGEKRGVKFLVAYAT